MAWEIRNPDRHFLRGYVVAVKNKPSSDVSHLYLINLFRLAPNSLRYLPASSHEVFVFELSERVPQFQNKPFALAKENPTFRGQWYSSSDDKATETVNSAVADIVFHGDLNPAYQDVLGPWILTFGSSCLHNSDAESNLIVIPDADIH